MPTKFDAILESDYTKDKSPSLYFGSNSNTGTVNGNPVYDQTAINQVLEQPECIALGTISKTFVSNNITYTQDFKQGLKRNSTGDLVPIPNGLLAAPCPEFCTGGMPLMCK